MGLIGWRFTWNCGLIVFHMKRILDANFWKSLISMVPRETNYGFIERLVYTQPVDNCVVTTLYSPPFKAVDKVIHS